MARAIVTLNGLPNVFPIAALSGPGVTFTPLFPYAVIATGAAAVMNGPTTLTIDVDSVAFTTVTLGTGSYAFSLEAKDTSHVDLAYVRKAQRAFKSGDLTATRILLERSIGARLATTAVNQLHKTGGRYALCTMCIGVGQGIAVILERV